MSDDAYAYPEAWAEEDFMENAKSDQPRENKYSCAPTYQETAADVVLWSDEWYMQGGASMEDDCKILEPTMDDEMTLEFSWSTQSIDQDPGGDTVQDYTSKSVAIEGVSQLEVRYRIDSGGQVSIEVVDRS